MTFMARASLGVAASVLLSASAFAQDNFTFAPNATPDGENIVLVINSDGDLTGPAATVNSATNNALEKALMAAEFEGKFGAKLHLYGLGDYQTLTIVGAGDEKLTARQLHDIGGTIAQAVDAEDSQQIVFETFDTDVTTPSAQLAAGFGLGAYKFDKYKEDRKDVDRTLSIMGDDASASQAAFEDDLAHLVKGVHFARDMGTEPGKTMYPALFAERVRDLFRGVGNVRVEVLGVKEMQRNNMGALMGVGKGSIHDPKLVVVTYTGGTSGDAPIALVGKGITFDTGGISLKPNSGQWLMKSDLSGAAAVAGSVYAAAKRGEEVNLVGVMAMAENMPAEDAIRPGDVLETMSGKTIEVMSTDAEGRLVLADAVTYVQEKHDPSLLIDIATLTGSAARAMGDDYAVVVTEDWDMTSRLMEIGKSAGEDVWPLPLNDNHFKAIKSDIADIKSTAGSPGASIGAAVIGTFVDEDRSWVHLDIAGVDWLTASRPTMPKGHAGWGVRFMDAVVRDMKDDE